MIGTGEGPQHVRLVGGVYIVERGAVRRLHPIAVNKILETVPHIPLLRLLDASTRTQRLHHRHPVLLPSAPCRNLLTVAAAQQLNQPWHHDAQKREGPRVTPWAV